jgi:hypothetical protein
VPGQKVCFGRFETSISFFNSCLKNSFWLFAEFESALNESAKALARAAEREEADRVAMSEATSAF